MRLPIHRWFRFSAGFSAQWAESVLDQHVSDAGVVCDPFAGSGTTLLAAQAAGMKSIGVENQPMLARIARAKLAWNVNPDVLAEAGLDVLSRAAGADSLSTVYEPPLLRKCYTPQVLSDLRSLQSAVLETHKGQPYDEMLWLALVCILRVTSHVGTAQWQYILPKKTKAQSVPPYEAFRDMIGVMVDDMRKVQGKVGAAPTSTLIEGDVRSTSDLYQDTVDFVLTSPPYANNYDYADATRLEMTFLGDISSWSDLRSIRSGLVHSSTQQMTVFDSGRALGSDKLEPIVKDLRPVYEELADVRQERAGKKAYHSMVVAYFYDMSSVWSILRGAVKPGGSACFVVGDSAPYGVHVPVEDWLGRLALGAGFSSYHFEKVRERNVKWKNRKHRVPLQEGHLWVKG